MSIRGFVLGVVLLATVGWCMVQESVKQTQARYILADLARREAEMENRLARLRAEEAALRSPARLTALVRKAGLNLVALANRRQPQMPQGGTAHRAGAAADAAGPGLEMASAGNL